MFEVSFLEIFFIFCLSSMTIERIICESEGISERFPLTNDKDQIYHDENFPISKISNCMLRRDTKNAN